jgi:type II secretory pathway component PulF
VLAETIRDAREQIMGGARMSETIRDAPYFPPALAYMIGVGEESGQLEDLLETVSDAYDDELRVAAEQFTSLLEPVMIILIAGGVFFVAMALLMPLMQMNQL